jgi:hypothetical protein
VANAWLWSSIPIAVPMANVTASPIPNVTSFGCAAKILTILDFSDIIKSNWKRQIFKDVVGFQLVK